MKTAFIFPGQGSQYAGMGKALAESFSSSRQVFEEADAALGESLSKLCFEGPEEDLRLTANTQPAILTVSIAALRAFEERGGRANFVAGHSLGEYSALVAGGSLKFADAVATVRKRGTFMQEAVPAGEGAMAALLGIDLNLVEEVCREAAGNEVCSTANINSPDQTVIAGNRAAVERAVALAKERGAKRAVMLQVSAPFHCELMKPAAERLRLVLEQIEFSDLNVPLITNVDARPETSGAAAREALVKQVASSVRWSDSIKWMLDEGVTRFVEIGPGKVLAGLARRMSREVKVFSIEDAQSLEAAAVDFGL